MKGDKHSTCGCRRVNLIVVIFSCSLVMHRLQLDVIFRRSSIPLVKIARYHVIFLQTLWQSSTISKIFSNLPLFQYSSLVNSSFEQYSSSGKSNSYWVCQCDNGWAGILHIKNVTWNSMVLSSISSLIKLDFLRLEYCVIYIHSTWAP